MRDALLRRDDVFEVFRQERRASRSRTPARSRRPTPRSPTRGRASSTAGAASRRRSGSCRATSIHAVTDWADEFDLKYRRVDGYSIKARLKEARERAGISCS